MTNEATLNDLYADIDRRLGPALDALYRDLIPIHGPEHAGDPAHQKFLRGEVVRLIGDQLIPELEVEEPV